jgi:hypothetical protein
MRWVGLIGLRLGLKTKTFRKPLFLQAFVGLGFMIPLVFLHTTVYRIPHPNDSSELYIITESTA